MLHPSHRMTLLSSYSGGTLRSEACALHPDDIQLLTKKPTPRWVKSKTFMTNDVQRVHPAPNSRRSLHGNYRPQPTPPKGPKKSSIRRAKITWWQCPRRHFSRGEAQRAQPLATPPSQSNPQSPTAPATCHNLHHAHRQTRHDYTTRRGRMDTKLPLRFYTHGLSWTIDLSIGHAHNRVNKTSVTCLFIIKRVQPLDTTKIYKNIYNFLVLSINVPL